MNDDEKRKTDKILSDHVGSLTDVVKRSVSDATSLIKDRQEDLLSKHEEMMAATHDHMVDASRLYREAVDKHLVSLQMAVQGSIVLVQDLKVAANKVKEKVFSVHVVQVG